MRKARKPKDLQIHDGEAECLDGDLVLEMVRVDAQEIYSAKGVRKLRKWLVKAEAWLKDRE